MPLESHYRFDDFHLDVANRQLLHGGLPVDLNARYFDALVLLVQEHGQLVAKDRFFSDVWDNAVVSDAALTQCIKDIRKLLGDDAANPRYIQTVPRHGYRFIGVVQIAQPAAAGAPTDSRPVAMPSLPQAAAETNDRPFQGSPSAVRKILTEGGAGTIGGALAGLVGGTIYGFALAYGPEAGIGAVSKLLVLISLCVIIGGMGGLGVSFGMATARVLAGGKAWTVIGAALGGLFIGGLAKLLGVDAFSLLFGVRPAGITGGPEGAVLGAAVALGLVLSGGLDVRSRQRPVSAAAMSGAAAGILIAVLGGRLMAGSLDLLTRSVAGSQLQLDGLGRYFGETGFGHLTLTVLSGFEGLLFGACVVGAMMTWGNIRQVGSRALHTRDPKVA